MNIVEADNYNKTTLLHMIMASEYVRMNTS